LDRKGFLGRLVPQGSMANSTRIIGDMMKAEFCKTRIKDKIKIRYQDDASYTLKDQIMMN
jgi:hypothetical protein